MYIHPAWFQSVAGFYVGGDDACAGRRVGLFTRLRLGARNKKLYGIASPILCCGIRLGVVL